MSINRLEFMVAPEVKINCLSSEDIQNQRHDIASAINQAIEIKGRAAVLTLEEIRSDLVDRATKLSAMALESRSPAVAVGSLKLALAMVEAAFECQSEKELDAVEAKRTRLHQRIGGLMPGR